MTKNIVLIILLTFSVSSFSAENKSHFHRTDSFRQVEEIIYITDTTYLPPDSIITIDTVRTSQKPIRPRAVRKNKRAIFYGETLGSLWAFTVSQSRLNMDHTTHIASNQQIIFNLGRMKNDWKYFIRFSQSRYAENSLQKVVKTKIDTLITEDSVYIKKNQIVQNISYDNYYLYSYIGTGISSKVKLDRKGRFSLHPSVMAGFMIPWNYKGILYENDQVKKMDMTPSVGLLIGMNSGLYVKIRENLHLIFMPEYSHLFVFKNVQPYSNRNVLNMHLGVSISTH